MCLYNNQFDPQFFNCFSGSIGNSGICNDHIHLAQGNVRLVIEALRERGRMRQNAPHLVKDMRFIIGNYKWWEQSFYTIGLTCYDILAGKMGLGHSLPLTSKKVINEIPGLKQDGLKGGVVYHDGQFDDARMAITLAQTAVDHGGTCLNYMKVTGLVKDMSGRICGVKNVGGFIKQDRHSKE